MNSKLRRGSGLTLDIFEKKTTNISLFYLWWQSILGDSIRHPDSAKKETAQNQSENSEEKKQTCTDETTTPTKTEVEKVGSKMFLSSFAKGAESLWN